MKRLAIEAVLMTFLACATGCIPVPVPHGGEAHNHWDGVAGSPESSARVRVGISDRASVVAALGKPNYVDGLGEDIDCSSGRVWDYRYLLLTGYTICLLPGPCNPLVGTNYSRDDYLTIWFDRKGRVQKYRVSDGYPSDLFEEERMLRDLPSTQPTTAPH
jgi:hypothetical protein